MTSVSHLFVTFTSLEIYFPTNTPRGFHVETTWKRPFPRRFNVESTWCVCRDMSLNSRLGIFQVYM